MIGRIEFSGIGRLNRAALALEVNTPMGDILFPLADEEVLKAKNGTLFYFSTNTDRDRWNTTFVKLGTTGETFGRFHFAGRISRESNAFKVDGSPTTAFSVAINPLKLKDSLVFFPEILTKTGSSLARAAEYARKGEGIYVTGRLTVPLTNSQIKAADHGPLFSGFVAEHITLYGGKTPEAQPRPLPKADDRSLRIKRDPETGGTVLEAVKEEFNDCPF